MKPFASKLAIPAIHSMLLCLSCLVLSADSFAVYSNREIRILPGHDLEFQNRLNEIFFTNNKLDNQKIQKKIEQLQTQKQQFAQWQYMSLKTRLIEKNNFSDEKSSKKAGKDEGLLPLFDHLISSLQALSKSSAHLNATQIQDEASRILILLLPLETTDKSNIYTPTIDALKKLVHNFYKFNLDDKKQLQASNLLSYEAKDLSTVNPPDSAFWQNNNVEKYDPRSEIFYQQKLFPPDQPNVVLDYKYMGRGSPKIKADYNGNSVTIKSGREVNAEILAAHLARAVGYPAIPLVYRQEILLNLGDTTYEQFLAEWTIAHGNEGFHNFAGRVEQVPAQLGYTNLVRLKQVALEAYPEDSLYEKIGPFRSGRNGLNNRREYRAQLLYAALINWSDSKERNIRVDMFRNNANETWQPIYFLNDVGMSMGDWYSVLNPGVVNTYRNHMTKKIGNTVFLEYLQSGQNPSTWMQATASDMKWLIRRYARLSEQQIYQMVYAAGYRGPVLALYNEKIKRRLNDLIEKFDLDNELKHFQETQYSSLHASYPKYINDEGELHGEYDKDMNGPIWYNGSRMTFDDAVKLGMKNFAIEQALKPNPKITEIVNKPIELGSIELSNGISFPCSRKVDINPLHGPGENRYLTTDKCMLTVPLGYVETNDRDNNRLHIELPINTFITWTLIYKHSHANQKDAYWSHLTDLIIPKTTKHYIDMIENGQELTLSQSYGFSIGGLGLELNDDLDAKIAVPRYFQTQEYSATISKNQGQRYELVINQNSTNGWAAGFDFSAYLKMRMMSGAETTHPRSQYYRFDLNLIPESFVKQSIRDLILNNQASDLLKNTKYTSHNVLARSGFSTKSFFIWDWNQFKSTASDEVTTHIDNPIESIDHVYSTSYAKQTGRDLKNLWTDEISASGAIKAVTNLATKAAGHGTQNSLYIEAVANDDFTDFKNLQATIDINRKANWANRKEFNEDFIQFFKNRSGEKTYFNYEMPAAIRYFSPIEGQMHWQMSYAAIKQMLQLLSLAAKNPNDGSEQERLKAKAGEVAINILSDIKSLQTIKDLSQRQQKLKAVIERMRTMIKMISENLNKPENIRDLVSTDDLWITCKLINALEYTTPAAIENDLFVTAPEIGHYQGPSYSQDRRFQFIDGLQLVH